MVCTPCCTWLIDCCVQISIYIAVQYLSQDTLLTCTGGRGAALPHTAPVRCTPQRRWQVRELPGDEGQRPVQGVYKGDCRAAASACVCVSDGGKS